MKHLLLMLLWSGASVAAAAAASNAVYTVYDASGARDPMVKPISLPLSQTGDTGMAAVAARETRRADIARVLATCTIEGVAISPTMRMAVINDRLLCEGDRLAPDVAIRIARISLDRIVFVLDDVTYEYKFSPPPETPR